MLSQGSEKGGISYPNSDKFNINHVLGRHTSHLYITGAIPFDLEDENKIVLPDVHKNFSQTTKA
jgi:hypothetical protein